MCSSTPRIVTAPKRAGWAAIASSNGRIARYTVRHVVPS